MKTLIWSSTFFLLLAGTVSAGDACPQPACCEPEQACCGKCGGASICKIVCEMKKVKKTVWTVECEEFCTMLPGCGPLGGLCCRDCGDQCGDCNSCGLDECCGGPSCDPCASLKRPMHPPTCGKVRTRKTLVKKDITCEVPVYKTVVVCAAGCGVCGAEAASELAAPIPASQTATAAPLPPVVRSGIVR